MGPRSARSVCLAELVASLSLATDLGLGQPEEHVLRQTVIADRLAALAGLDDAARRSIFYVSLLAWVGCVSDSHEMAKWFGDDRVLRVDSYEVDKVGLPMIRFMVDHVAAGSGSFRRLSMVGRFLAGGLRDAMNSFVTHCETAGDIADRLGLDSRVRIALGQAFERWDGKGTPAGLKGEAVEAAMRVVQVADEVEVFGRFGGAVSVRDMLQRRLQQARPLSQSRRSIKEESLLVRKPAPPHVDAYLNRDHDGGARYEHNFDPCRCDVRRRAKAQ
jgi:hypothetical protein